MKILFQNACFSPGNHEGSSVHIHQLIRQVQTLGHEVLVSPESPVSDAERLVDSRLGRVRQLRSVDAVYYRMAGEALMLPVWSRAPWLRALLGKPTIWEINLTPIIVALSRKWQVPDAVDRETAVIARQARAVQLAICNTQGLAIWARDLGISSTIVIPLGSDPEQFKPSKKPSAAMGTQDRVLNVLWMGNAGVWWHDIETMVEAARLLREDRRIMFHFLCVLPKKLEYPPNVRILEQRPHSEMPALLASMDVGMAIYRDDRAIPYGACSSPLKLFDYLASGMIPVASPIEQVRACIKDGHNGYIVPFGDPAALAQRLVAIAEAGDALAPLRLAARQTVVDYYNWRRVAQETVNSIQSVLRHRNVLGRNVLCLP